MGDHRLEFTIEFAHLTPLPIGMVSLLFIGALILIVVAIFT
jgi:hypothetical protein